MNISFKCVPIDEGIVFGSVRDPRFKTNRISVNLVTSLTADTVTCNALIPSILKDGFRGCETFTQMYQRMENLYGASVDADVHKRGDRQILTISITSLDDRFALKQEEISREAAGILCDMLLHPLLEGDGFSAKYTELEKAALTDTIEAEINEKRGYAINHMLRTMCENEPYGLPKYGFKERVADITPKDAYVRYQTLLKEAQIYILFTGCGEEEPVLDEFRTAFSGLERAYAGMVKACPHPHSGENVKEQIEQMEVSQSKMVLGFSGGIEPTDKRLPALRLMAAVLGGTPSSKLFVNVREKLSLCYYCASMLDTMKSVLIVDCGVESENIEKAKQEILTQLEEIKQGNITAEELESARLSLQNAYATIYENDYTIESFYLGQLLNGLHSSPEEEREKLSQVTMQDIQAAAHLLRLDTVYVLTGKEGE